jgi:hypothetical protein
MARGVRDGIKCMRTTMKQRTLAMAADHGDGFEQYRRPRRSE